MSQAVVAHLLNPALGRQRQTDYCEFEANLVYRASSRTGTKATQRNPVSKKKSNNNQKSVYGFVFLSACGYVQMNAATLRD